MRITSTLCHRLTMPLHRYHNYISPIVSIHRHADDDAIRAARLTTPSPIRILIDAAADSPATIRPVRRVAD